MKHNWSLILVMVFLLATGMAERLSSYYVDRLKAKADDLDRQKADLSARTDRAAAEATKYQEIEKLAALVEKHIRYESDSTRVIRSFGETAARRGVKLLEARTVQPTQGTATVASGAYERMCIDMRLLGSFWGLCQYAADVEASPRPTVIESLVIGADRDRNGVGEMRMTVSALYPVPSADEGPGATTGDAR